MWSTAGRSPRFAVGFVWLLSRRWSVSWRNGRSWLSAPGCVLCPRTHLDSRWPTRGIACARGAGEGCAVEPCVTANYPCPLAVSGPTSEEARAWEDLGPGPQLVTPGGHRWTDLAWACLPSLAAFQLLCLTVSRLRV